MHTHLTYQKDGISDRFGGYLPPARGMLTRATLTILENAVGVNASLQTVVLLLLLDIKAFAYDICGVA